MSINALFRRLLTGDSLSLVFKLFLLTRVSKDILGLNADYTYKLGLNADYTNKLGLNADFTYKLGLNAD